MSANSGPITCRGLPPRSCSQRTQPIIQRRRSTHRLLRRSRNDGKQVRPWLAKPKMTAAPRVRESDRELTSQSHQGQRHDAAHKVRMYGCNLVPSNHYELSAWQTRGRPCTVIEYISPVLRQLRSAWRNRCVSPCATLRSAANHTSRARIWRSISVGQRVNTIDCRRWRLILSGVRWLSWSPPAAPVRRWQPRRRPRRFRSSLRQEATRSSSASSPA